MSQEGRRSLYKGMTAPLLGMTPCYGLAFLGYSFGKTLFCDADAFTELKLNQIGMAGALSTLFVSGRYLQWSALFRYKCYALPTILPVSTSAHSPHPKSAPLNCAVRALDSTDSFFAPLFRGSRARGVGHRRRPYSGPGT